MRNKYTLDKPLLLLLVLLLVVVVVVLRSSCGNYPMQ